MSEHVIATRIMFISTFTLVSVVLQMMQLKIYLKSLASCTWIQLEEVIGALKTFSRGNFFMIIFFVTMLLFCLQHRTEKPKEET